MVTETYIKKVILEGSSTAVYFRNFKKKCQPIFALRWVSSFIGCPTLFIPFRDVGLRGLAQYRFLVSTRGQPYDSHPGHRGKYNFLWNSERKGNRLFSEIYRRRYYIPHHIFIFLEIEYYNFRVRDNLLFPRRWLYGNDFWICPSSMALNLWLIMSADHIKKKKKWRLFVNNSMV